MKIAADVAGSDKGIKELVLGCIQAINEYNDIELVLIGNQNEILPILTENNSISERITIKHTEVIMDMHDEAGSIVKQKKDSSMGIGLTMTANKECDAFVSAGNSGALILGSTLIVKRIKGIKRPAFAPILPSSNGGVMLIDCGANSEIKSAEYLDQFGLMGSVYMEKIMNKKNPVVGLISNGVEDSKGTDLTREALKIMQKSKYNFIGYIEGNDVVMGKVDVAVTDGFTGNILLKSMEGLGKVIVGNMKVMFKQNVFTMFSALLISKGLNKFKKNFDSKEYGGAIVLGVNSPVIKAHGSSDAVAFKNAIRQAREVIVKNVIGEICDKF